MKIYISSKASGILNYNREAFGRKTAELHNLGFEVHNPLAKINELEDKSSWAAVIGKDMIDLEDCDIIHMFGLWYRAQGCWIELFTAHRLNISIDINQWWLRWIPTALNILCKVKGKEA